MADWGSVAKAQEDFRWSDMSLASWQWEQLMSCFCQPPSLTLPITFPLAFPGGKLSLEVRSFIFVLVVGCGVLLFFGICFFFSLFGVLFTKNQKMLFRQLLGFPCPVQWQQGAQMCSLCV